MATEYFSTTRNVAIPAADVHAQRIDDLVRGQTINAAVKCHEATDDDEPAASERAPTRERQGSSTYDGRDRLFGERQYDRRTDGNKSKPCSATQRRCDADTHSAIDDPTGILART